MNVKGGLRNAITEKKNEVSAVQAMGDLLKRMHTQIEKALPVSYTHLYMSNQPSLGVLHFPVSMRHHTGGSFYLNISYKRRRNFSCRPVTSLTNVAASFGILSPNSLMEVSIFS